MLLLFIQCILFLFLVFVLLAHSFNQSLHCIMCSAFYFIAFLGFILKMFFISKGYVLFGETAFKNKHYFFWHDLRCTLGIN